MIMPLNELNAASEAEASELFRSCCGASSWIDAMVKRRPYESVDQLLATADSIWESSGKAAWHEAFSHHPRIGESASAAERTGRAQAWSQGEQAGARMASSGVHDQMALVNRAYEAKFGHIYIASAAGKSAEDLLSLARVRLSNDPETELKAAAEEQGKITRLRLNQLFGGAQ